MGQHLDDPAQGVAVLVAGIDLGDHACRGGRIGTSHWIGIDTLQIIGGRTDAVRHMGRSDPDDVGEDLHPHRLGQEGLGHGCDAHPCRRLACRGAFQNRSGLVEVILLHPHQIGVTGTRTGEWRCTGLIAQIVGIHGIGCHDGAPPGPFGVGDAQRDR